MIRYKVNIIEELQNRGYTAGKIQKEKLLPGQNVKNIKAGK